PGGVYSVAQPLPSGWAETFPPFVTPATTGEWAVFLDRGEALGALAFGRSQVAGVGAPALPHRVSIAAVMPNPAVGRTTIAFTTVIRGSVDVRVFDAGGRAVADLSAGVMNPGAHTVDWDGRAATGARLPAG